MRIGAVLPKIYKIKNLPIYIWNLSNLYHFTLKSPFLCLCVIVQAQGALRDLRYFFLTNNLRFVKTFLQMRIGAVLLQTWKLTNHQNSAIFYQICVNLHRIMPFSWFTCYSTSRRSSAGSQTFFLDKQFEICQNFSADENRSCPSPNMRNQKSSIHGIYYPILCQFT